MSFSELIQANTSLSIDKKTPRILLEMYAFWQSNLKEKLTSQRSAIHLTASDRVGSNFDPPHEGLALLPIV
jgi:hypothetical protein